MEPVRFRAEPEDAEAIWHVPTGLKYRFNMRFGIISLFFLIPMTLTATLGTISTGGEGALISWFWPAAAFQVILSAWFGVYGVLVGVVGPLLSMLILGEPVYHFMPAHLVQCLIVALYFRWRKLDPRLRTKRDWRCTLIVGCIISQMIGGIIATVELYLRTKVSGSLGEPGPGADYWMYTFLGWWLGCSIPCLILVPASFKTASAMVVRSPVFCQSFWGSVDIFQGKKLPSRFDDLPVVAKLMLLIEIAGLVPLTALAGWIVWSEMHRADRLALESNHFVVQIARDEIDRHELLMRDLADSVQQTGLEEQERAAMLAEWSGSADGFSQLEICGISELYQEIPEGLYDYADGLDVLFYKTDLVDEEGDNLLRCVAPLKTMPGRALAGLVTWRDEEMSIQELAADGAILVMDNKGRILYRDSEPLLDEWAPQEEQPEKKMYTIEFGGKTWNVAEAKIERLGWRFIRLSSAKAGQAVVLSSLPNPLAMLINLAIFASLIAGCGVARRISERMLKIADHVRESGAEPGQLHIPVRGRDELGYLATTLNHMSEDLADNIRKLKETVAEKERLSAELNLARDVQLGILPTRPPVCEGYDLAGVCYPAREVGGDFFDYFMTPNNELMMMIGDAVGKGLKAAMYITETHGLARAAALQNQTPEQILEAVNNLFISVRGENYDFVTMFCGQLQMQEHCLTYANAGHHPPVILRNGKTNHLALGDLPLAIASGKGYRLNRIDLQPGDAVVLYTDGVTEAFNPQRDMFGVERLEALLRETKGASAEDILHTVVRTVDEFVDGGPQSDDITIVVVKRCQGPGVRGQVSGAIG